MKKYFIQGSKNFLIGISYLFSQILVLQFINPAETWVVLPNGITFSNLALIVIGCLIFSIGAVNLFFAGLFLDISKSHSIKEHIYIHGAAVARWGFIASGFILLVYLILILTSILHFDPDGVKAFAGYKEASRPFICALTERFCEGGIY